MMKFVVFASVLALVWSGRASWYWPFGSEDAGDNELPRISELTEPATLLIDEATDLAADGKVDEAVERYRKALTELDRIERENPERAKRPEFATLRNKRAYVNAAIDSMLLSQVKSNARAVAVSDTTELEKRLAEEKANAKKAEIETKRKSIRERAMVNLAAGKYESAERAIHELLLDDPLSMAALNLKAVMEARQGKYQDAEKTLEKAISVNPRDCSAYYNLARLVLRTHEDGKSLAKRYYEKGREVGGAVNSQLEDEIK